MDGQSERKTAEEGAVLKVEQVLQEEAVTAFIKHAHSKSIPEKPLSDEWRITVEASSTQRPVAMRCAHAFK